MVHFILDRLYMSVKKCIVGNQRNLQGESVVAAILNLDFFVVKPAKQFH